MRIALLIFNASKRWKILVVAFLVVWYLRWDPPPPRYLLFGDRKWSLSDFNAPEDEHELTLHSTRQSCSMDFD